MNFGYTAADCLFQSTLPHGERPLHWLSAGLCLRFQSTLPHGERRKAPPLPWGCYLISIHAPARGATRADIINRFRSGISIHAPARGATKLYGHILTVFNDFNPRSRTGSDSKHPALFAALCDFNPRSRTGSDDLALVYCPVLSISIHAPARGATVGFHKITLFLLEFQSTLPHGERRVKAVPAVRHHLFQSTLPHGERPLDAASPAAERKFQSTLPHGERPFFSLLFSTF